MAARFAPKPTKPAPSAPPPEVRAPLVDADVTSPPPEVPLEERPTAPIKPPPPAPPPPPPEPPAEPAPPAPNLTRFFKVMRTCSVPRATDGLHYTLPEGKIIRSGSYDIDALRALGVPLEETKETVSAPRARIL